MDLKDYYGEDLCLGDVVIFTEYRGDATLKQGFIKNITKKNVIIGYLFRQLPPNDANIGKFTFGTGGYTRQINKEQTHLYLIKHKGRTVILDR